MKPINRSAIRSFILSEMTDYAKIIVVKSRDFANWCDVLETERIRMEAFLASNGYTINDDEIDTDETQRMFDAGQYVIVSLIDDKETP